MGNCSGGELSWCGVVLVGNCSGGELSWWGVVLVGNCHVGKLSWWAVVLVGNCPGGESVADRAPPLNFDRLCFFLFSFVSECLKISVLYM